MQQLITQYAKQAELLYAVQNPHKCRGGSQAIVTSWDDMRKANGSRPQNGLFRTQDTPDLG